MYFPFEAAKGTFDTAGDDEIQVLHKVDDASSPLAVVLHRSSRELGSLEDTPDCKALVIEHEKQDQSDSMECSIHSKLSWVEEASSGWAHVKDTML